MTIDVAVKIYVAIHENRETWGSCGNEHYFIKWGTIQSGRKIPFGGYLLFPSWTYNSTRKMKAVGLSETVNFNQRTWCHMPEDGIFFIFITLVFVSQHDDMWLIFAVKYSK